MVLVCLMMENVCWLQGHAERLKHWVCMAVVLLVVALILHFTDGNVVITLGEEVILRM